MTTYAPTVFLVDDDHAVRDALEMLLDTAGFRTVTYSTASEFLEQYDANCPGCLVLDIRMPGMSGMELQDELVNQTVGLPIIFLTGHGNVSMSAKAFRTGAVDFLEKPFDEAVLLERIQEALGLDHSNRKAEARHVDAVNRLSPLTPREYEVMLLIVTGNSNKEVASQLDLSTRTIETHRSRIMDKAGVQSVAELVELAITAGSNMSK